MRPRLRLASLLVLLATALVGAGCGGDDSNGGGSSAGSDDAQALLAKAFAKPVESAELDVDVKADLDGLPIGGPIAFSIKGPYKSNGAREVPSADFDVDIGVAGQTLKGGFAMSPQTAYVEFQGQAYEAGQAFDLFKRAYANQPKGKSGSANAAFGQLGIDPSKWLTNAAVSDGPDVGGDPTRKITGDVDVERIVEESLKAAESPAVRKQLERSGTPVPKTPDLSDDQIDQIMDAVKSATLEIDVDENDVARRIAAAAKFEIPDGVQAGGLKGGTLSFTYALPKLDVPVDVKPPANPKPLSDLLSGLGLGGLALPQQQQ
jgi:hypothetical protein